MQVKLYNPLRTRAIPERFCGGDSLQRGAISSVCIFYFYMCLSVLTAIFPGESGFIGAKDDGGDGDN